MDPDRQAPKKGLGPAFPLGCATVLALAGVLLLLFARDAAILRVLGVLALVLSLPVLLWIVVARLLWRVGTRLFVSYVLIGIVPLPCLLAMAWLTALMLAAEFAGHRLDGALDERGRRLERLATEVVARPGDAPPPAAGPVADGLPAPCVVEEIASGERLVGCELGADVRPLAIVGRYTEPFVVRLASSSQRQFCLVAVAGRPDRALALLLPIDRQLVDDLARETGLRLEFGDLASTVAAEPAAERGPFDGEWVSWFHVLPVRLVDWSTGRATGVEPAVVELKTSLAREFRELTGFTGFAPIDGEDDYGRIGGSLIAISFLGLLGLTALVYLGASTIAAVLVSRIVRTTSRLARGFRAIEAGDFEHRAQLAGNDQLAGLVGGFNAMAGHLAAGVAERSRRESLERELELARELQQRLLPAPDFRFDGLDIAVDFRPAAAIGGDFYHFIAEGSDRLVVVIADVSGHGLATGIVMASAKASLSALASTGTDTLQLFAALDREIHASTDRRTFVTLGHLRFDFLGRRLSFTNAGHLPPWRIDASGRLSTLDNRARPLGVALPRKFRTVEAPLVPGDIWVLASDGIVEAGAAAGEILGFERVEEILREAPRHDAAALRDHVLARWREFVGGDVPEDDRTLLVLRVCERREGASAPGAAGR